jgi:chemotaxis protein MotB
MSARVEEKPDGAPEWMVSFADMITIMMSFFVIMFAIASGEAAKGKKNRTPLQQAAIDSISHRFGPSWKPFASWGLMTGNSPVKLGGGRKKIEPPPLEDQGPVKTPQQKPRIRVPGRGERIAIGGIAYFQDATIELPDAQKSRLGVIAEELAGKPQEIEVVGHASVRPLPSGTPYHDRWDLAYARCRRVAQLLRDMKIDPDRIRVSVVRAADALDPGDPAGTPADCQVDIYLSDTEPERYTLD